MTLLAPGRSIAQRKACPMPENGSWQLVTNDHHPRKVTIKFFDLSGHLVYQEHLIGASPDWHKKSTCRALNRSLQTALTAYNENRRLSPGLAQKDQLAKNGQ
jgi:hypothetical protein